jgi:hypothetical protein
MYTECIKHAWTNFRSYFPKSKQGKKFILIHVDAQQHVDLNSSDFLSVGNLKTLVYSAPIENE